jgi:hypothetical protein
VNPVAQAGRTVGFVTHLEPDGFVVMRADDQAPPIKLYSSKGTLAGLPPEFVKVIQSELAGELAALDAMRNAKTALDDTFSKQWASLLDPALTSPSTAKAAGSMVDKILIATSWTQSEPYNYYAPLNTNGHRGFAGCVPVAMGQILRFHKQPAHVANSKTGDSYFDEYPGSGQTLWMTNAGLANYDWPNMPYRVSVSSPIEQQEAVGQLLFHCAVAVRAQFASDGTGALPEAISPAFRNYFDYACGEFESREAYPGDRWYQKVKSEIDANRPVFYSFISTETGHAVVCDGYQSTIVVWPYTYGYIHLNFGWDGAGDAWYNPDNVQAGGTAWIHHKAIFGIAPNAPVMGSPLLSENSEYQLTVTGPSGLTYEIQVSTNMLNWTTLTNVYTATGKIQFADTAARPPRFYRALRPR